MPWPPQLKALSGLVSMVFVHGLQDETGHAFSYIFFGFENGGKMVYFLIRLGTESY